MMIDRQMIMMIDRQIDRQVEREREREREKGHFDSSKGQWKDFSVKQVSVIQVDIRLQRRNSTLVPDSSLLIGMTLVIWHLHSLIPTGRLGLQSLFVTLFL